MSLVSEEREGERKGGEGREEWLHPAANNCWGTTIDELFFSLQRGLYLSYWACSVYLAMLWVHSSTDSDIELLLYLTGCGVLLDWNWVALLLS